MQERITEPDYGFLPNSMMKQMMTDPSPDHKNIRQAEKKEKNKRKQAKKARKRHKKK